MSAGKKNIKQTILKILSIVIASVLVLAGLAILYFRLPVSSYYKVSNKTFKIPGISDGFIAQGITLIPEDGDFYITGYMDDGSASPIYIVDKATNTLEKTIKMANPDGSAFTGHAGGLSYFEGMLYLAGSTKNCVYAFDPAEIKNASDGASIAYKYPVNLKTETDKLRVSFTTAHNGVFYVGEYHKDPGYSTVDSHEVKTQDGSQKALLFGFTIDGEIATPYCAYSMPDIVQGACFTDDKLYLSCSAGPAFSHIYTYSLTDLPQSGTINVLGVDVPLYVLDSSVLIDTDLIAPMSEELEITDGKMYIMCESASNKHVFGKFTGADYCYAADLNALANN